MCGGWYSTVLWIPEYFKARGAGDSSLYAESFAVAAANLPGVSSCENGHMHSNTVSCDALPCCITYVQLLMWSLLTDLLLA
jgi:hypothetical protein